MKANTLIISWLTLIYLSSCSEKYQPEKIYLPKNYIGWIYIVYNQKEGTKEREGGYRVYNIPKNGILLTQYDINQGWVSKNGIQIYRELEDNKSELIPNEMDFNIDSSFRKTNANIIFGYSLPTHSCGKYVIYATFVDTLKNSYKYNTGELFITESLIDSVKSNLIK